MFAIVPPVVPQIGTYQFHGAAGNVKTLVVRTANNDSLKAVFGEPEYITVLETSFGVGALQVGAKKKSLVTAVDFAATDSLTGFPATNYTTDNWKWTTGDFPSAPDDLSGINVTSLYNPLNITWFVNLIFHQNVTVQNGAIYLAQLPTPVAQYLGAIVWEPKWENIGNTVVHHAEYLDVGLLAVPPYYFIYYHNCTETWTYDGTYGSWIGYKLQANSTTIYEFSIELPTTAAIPGFEFPILLGVSGFSAIGLIYLVMKKRNK
jgi:hypothetical protein